MFALLLYNCSFVVGGTVSSTDTKIKEINWNNSYLCDYANNDIDLSDEEDEESGTAKVSFPYIQVQAFNIGANFSNGM